VIEPTAMTIRNAERSENTGPTFENEDSLQGCELLVGTGQSGQQLIAVLSAFCPRRPSDEKPRPIPSTFSEDNKARARFRNIARFPAMLVAQLATLQGVYLYIALDEGYSDYQRNTDLRSHDSPSSSLLRFGQQLILVAAPYLE